MIRKKKKSFDAISADSSYRRPGSSLKVNLSCASNLTDSGNDSLKFVVNNVTAYGFPLKNASIVLERIDANKENVGKLGDSSVRSSVATRLRTNDLNNSISKNRLSTKRVDAADKIERKNGKNNASQSICNTSKTTCQNKNLRSTNCSRILRKIQSYDVEEHVNDFDKNVISKSRTAKELVQLRNGISNGNDDMLIEIDDVACSSKETNHLKFNYSIICKNRFSQSSISTISENDLAIVPIGCSTMLDDNVSDEEGNEHSAHIFVQEVSKNKSNHVIQEPQQTNNELMDQSVYDKETEIIGTDSVNTVRTSLNVNTSLDVINSENSSKRKRKNCENGSIKKKRKIEDSIVSDLVQESINTVRTSLQMNTSYTSNQLQNSANIDTVGISARDSIQTIDINDPNDIGKNNFDDRKSNSHKRKSQGEVTSEKTDSIKCDQNRTSISSSITNKSANKIETENNENVKDIAQPTTKRRRRKLLPLNECSQLVSFTPVEDERPLPRSLIFKKQLRNKKNNKRNKNNSSSAEENCMIIEDKKNDKGKKTQRKPRKVISKKIVVKKIADEHILRKLKENREDRNKPEAANVCNSDGSSNDFQPQERVLKKKRVQKLYIVVTGLSNEDKSLVGRAVQDLGSAKIERNVTKNTTHVVTSGVRTLNLLHGIIRGCWLVSLEWVLKSLESKEWLIPENYEMAHFSKAVSENRKDRQLFGKSYISELFTACGNIYIEETTKPPSDALKDLVKAAGGSITENPETAKILIGSGGLKATWIVDCIMSGELQPYNQYQQS